MPNRSRTPSLTSSTDGDTLSNNNGTDQAKCLWCRRSTFRLFVFIGFFIAYLCCGALCFMWIESPYEHQERAHLRMTRTRFLKRHTCVTDRDLEEFIQGIVHASERGVSVLNNATVSELNWSFGQSVFFSTTVVTTVGYGRTAPLSQGGKLFCVFFALVGIPLTLIMFTAIIERLLVVSQYFINFLQRTLPPVFSEFHVRVINLTIVLLVHVLIFTLVPAAIFDFIEKDWTYLDSVYFCFITWTTVGLGDFVPGEQFHQGMRPFYKILSSMYLFLSLISMLFLLKTFHDTPHLNIGLRIYMDSDIIDEERVPLRPGDHGPKYTRQVDESLTSIARPESSANASVTAREEETRQTPRVH